MKNLDLKYGEIPTIYNSSTGFAKRNGDIRPGIVVAVFTGSIVVGEVGPPFII